MNALVKILVSAVVVSMVSGCSTFDLLKERRDGNVVQLVAAHHIKTGRMLSDGAVISGTNAAVSTSMLGGGTGTSLAAGGAVILLEKLLASTADEHDYGVIVSRPDDLVLVIGAPNKPRRNDIGNIRFTPLMNGVRIGDWVKVVKTVNYWTLVPCKLPESGCQEKVLQISAASAAK